MDVHFCGVRVWNRWIGHALIVKARICNCQFVNWAKLASIYIQHRLFAWPCSLLGRIWPGNFICCYPALRCNKKAIIVTINPNLGYRPASPKCSTWFFLWKHFFFDLWRQQHALQCSSKWEHKGTCSKKAPLGSSHCHHKQAESRQKALATAFQ